MGCFLRIDHISKYFRNFKHRKTSENVFWCFCISLFVCVYVCAHGGVNKMPPFLRFIYGVCILFWFLCMCIKANPPVSTFDHHISLELKLVCLCCMVGQVKHTDFTKLYRVWMYVNEESSVLNLSNLPHLFCYHLMLYAFSFFNHLPHFPLLLTCTVSSPEHLWSRRGWSAASSWWWSWCWA